jgi:hypothetical protein
MPKSVHITAPWPTLEEMLRHSRISKTRKKELAILLEKAKAELSQKNGASISCGMPGKRRKSASAA